MNVLAGCDFFTVEVLHLRGLATYYVLFFLHLESRRIQIAGITRHPDSDRSRARKRWREDDSTARQKPESDCVRGTLGSLHKTGVPV